MPILSVCGSLQARSSNRAALDVVHAVVRDAGATIDEYDGLALIPPLNPDHADDAGSVAGVVKNALDWIVGSGELYTKPVGLVNVGTSGGYHARRALVQTLTWQGAHVVASLGVDAPKTKSDADGHFADPATVAALEAFARVVIEAPERNAAGRLAAVRAIVEDAGVDTNHIAPLD